jgi:hypothetical protein
MAGFYNEFDQDGTGGGVYDLASPTNITVGGIPSGTDLTGMTWQEIIQMLTITYLAPLASLTGGGIREFGASPDVTLSWIATKRSRTITGITVNGTPIVPTGSTQSGTEPATATQNVDTTFSMSVTDGITTATATTSVVWEFRKYVGVDSHVTLNESQIESLSLSNNLATTLNGTYSFVPSATYKYFCCPDSFPTPTATTGFKDATTLLPIGMATILDDPFYSNSSNGWSYGLVSVTNTYGVTTNYRVYRSKNVLNGSIDITVS